MSSFKLFAVEDSGPRALPVPPGATQFADLYRGLPLGVYDALRTFGHNRFLYLDRHLARTTRSMALLGWDYRLDEARLRRALHAVVTGCAWPEMRARIDILAAPAETLGTTSRELIALQQFTPPPPSLYKEGVTVDFAAGLRRENPLAKTAEFAANRPVTGSHELRVTSDDSNDVLNSSLVTQHSSLAPPYEYLLLDDGGRSSRHWGSRCGWRRSPRPRSPRWTRRRSAARRGRSCRWSASRGNPSATAARGRSAAAYWRRMRHLWRRMQGQRFRLCHPVSCLSKTT
ncbi:MAG: hypothetical protein DCC51_15250 [Anaerolineae bacterium]|nr:MAG: hypothetical protein DCC51_15250 [Anaerolineae bacterium]